MPSAPVELEPAEPVPGPSTPAPADALDPDEAAADEPACENCGLAERFCECHDVEHHRSLDRTKGSTMHELLLNGLRKVRDSNGYDLSDAQDRALFRQALRRATDSVKVSVLKEARRAGSRQPGYRDRDGTTYQLAEHRSMRRSRPRTTTGARRCPPPLRAWRDADALADLLGTTTAATVYAAPVVRKITERRPRRTRPDEMDRRPPAPPDDRDGTARPVGLPGRRAARAGGTVQPARLPDGERHRHEPEQHDPRSDTVTTRFTLHVESDDADLTDDPDAAMADLLRRLANVIGCRGTFDGEGTARDANGNTVGRWTMTADDPEPDDDADQDDDESAEWAALNLRGVPGPWAEPIS
jgi:hypothetical protein